MAPLELPDRLRSAARLLCAFLIFFAALRASAAVEIFELRAAATWYGLDVRQSQDGGVTSDPIGPLAYAEVWHGDGSHPAGGWWEGYSSLTGIGIDPGDGTQTWTFLGPTGWQATVTAAEVANASGSGHILWLDFTPQVGGSTTMGFLVSSEFTGHALGLVQPTTAGSPPVVSPLSLGESASALSSTGVGPGFSGQRASAPVDLAKPFWVADFTTGLRAPDGAVLLRDGWVANTLALPLVSVSIYFDAISNGDRFTLHWQLPGPGQAEMVQSLTAAPGGGGWQQMGDWGGEDLTGTVAITGSVAIGANYWVTRDSDGWGDWWFLNPLVAWPDPIRWSKRGIAAPPVPWQTVTFNIAFGYGWAVTVHQQDGDRPLSPTYGGTFTLPDTDDWGNLHDFFYEKWTAQVDPRESFWLSGNGTQGSTDDPWFYNGWSAIGGAPKVMDAVAFHIDIGFRGTAPNATQGPTSTNLALGMMDQVIEDYNADGTPNFFHYDLWNATLDVSRPYFLVVNGTMLEANETWFYNGWVRQNGAVPDWQTKTFTIASGYGWWGAFVTQTNNVQWLTPLYMNGYFEDYWNDDSGNPNFFYYELFTATVDFARPFTLTVNGQALPPGDTSFFNGWIRQGGSPTPMFTLNMTVIGDRVNHNFRLTAPDGTFTEFVPGGTQATATCEMWNPWVPESWLYSYSTYASSQRVAWNGTAGWWTLRDKDTGEERTFHPGGAHSYALDASQWWLPASSVTLQVSLSRWGHDLRIRQRDGNEYPITPGSSQGSLVLTPGGTWVQSYYYFDATGSRRAMTGMDWWVYDATTGEYAPAANTTDLIGWIWPLPPVEASVAQTGAASADVSWLLGFGTRNDLVGGGFRLERTSDGGNTWDALTTGDADSFMNILDDGTLLFQYSDSTLTAGNSYFYRIFYFYGSKESGPAQTDTFTLLDSSSDQDSDGDGTTDYWEYHFGTDPHDPASKPPALGIATDPGALEMQAGGTLSFTVTAVGGIPPLAIMFVEGSGPGRGSLTQTATGGTLNATFTDNATASGTASFGVIVTDATGKTVTATVTITITGEPPPPELVVACAVGTLDAAGKAVITLTASGGTGQGYVFFQDGAPMNGTVSIAGNVATYQTTNGGAADMFTVSAHDDGDHYSITPGVVTIEPYQVVTVDGKTAALAADGKVTISLTAQGGTEPYEFSLVDGPANGTVTIDNTVTPPTATYESTATPRVADSFTVNATDSSDPTLASDYPGTISITLPDPSAITIVNDNAVTHVKAGEIKTLTFSASGGTSAPPLTFAITDGPTADVGSLGDPQAAQVVAGITNVNVALTAAKTALPGTEASIHFTFNDTFGNQADGVATVVIDATPSGPSTDTEIEYCESCTCIGNEFAKQTKALTQGEKANSDGTCPKTGMAYYGVDPYSLALRISDRPLPYRAAFGPGTGIILNYDSPSDAPEPEPAGYTHLGPLWKMNFIQFVEAGAAAGDEDTLNFGRSAKVDYQAAGGGTNKSPKSGYAKDRLVRVSESPLRYEHRLTNGTVEIYDVPGGTSADGRTRLFLAKIRDDRQLEATLVWQPVAAGLRLTGITDATGRTSHVHYDDAGHPLRVTRISDPFGRTVAMHYDDAVTGLLDKLTDPVGIESKFHYAPGTGSVDVLETPYGQTFFARSWQAEGGVNTGKRLDVTDPAGRASRYELRNWVVGWEFGNEPEPWPGALVSRTGPYSFYWSPQGLAAGSDIANAHAVQWAMDETGTPTRAVASSKAPLTNREWTERDPWQNREGRAGATQGASRISRVWSNEGERSRYGTETAEGLPASSTDEAGRRLDYTYHANLRDLYQVKHTATVNGAPVVTTLVTLELYDHGRPTKITAADGTVSRVYFNARGQVNRTVNAIGQDTRVTFDEAPGSPSYGRRLAVTAAFGTPLETTVQYGYDAAGRLATVTDAEGGITALEYDAIGGVAGTLDRVTQVTYPDGKTERVEWEVPDPEHFTHPLHVKKSFDVEGRATEFEYDGNGEVTKVTGPDGKVTEYLRGNCCGGGIDTLVDAAGHQTHWEYDVLGRKVAKYLNWAGAGDTPVATYGYDAVGRLVSQQDARGNVRNHVYDGAGQLSVIQYAVNANNTRETPALTFTYEPGYGRLEAVTETALSGVVGVTSYTYQPINGTPGSGALATESRAATPGGSGNYTHTYTYDAAGRRVSGPRQDSAQWDALGRLTNVVTGLGAGEVHYAGQTGRVEWAKIGDLRTDFGYTADVNKRLASIAHQWVPDAALELTSHSYEYDAVGRLTTWSAGPSAAVANPAGATRTWAMTYDGSEQLTNVAATRRAPDGTVLWTGTHLFGYDAGGNRTGATQPGVGARTWTANGLNQLTGETNGPGYTYDLDGNLLSDGTRTYQWDAENRLVSVTYNNNLNVTQWDYDAFGRRVRQRDSVNEGASTESRELIWDGLSLIESRITRNATLDEIRQYYGNGESRTTTLNSQPSTLNLYYTTDHLGSIREMVDGAGNIKARYEYSPYGERTKVAGDLDSDFGYTGHYTHDPTGLVAAPYRFYEPATGRWLSRDPIEEEGGINLYGYVGNGPTMQIDPLGLRFVADTNGLTEEQRQSFITELARLRKTASGCQLYNYLHSSDKVITLKFQKMEGFDGKADVRNNGGSITFSPGVSYDNIGHEFQHAAEGLSGKPDPMGFGDIVRPADEKEFPGDTSTPTECRAVRVQNRVLGEGGGSPRRYYGKTEIPYPLGTRGPKTLPAGLK